jgi:hypothetical protein
MNRPHYQVMCTWGLSGVNRLGIEADVTIWVDTLISAGVSSQSPGDFPGSGRVILSSLPDAFAVANWVADLQLELHKRLNVLVVCAGEATHNIADQLAAGAVIEQLAARGLDALSPEAAVANASFLQLRQATAHLIAASEGWANSIPPDFTMKVDESITTGQVRILR